MKEHQVTMEKWLVHFFLHKNDWLIQTLQSWVWTLFPYDKSIDCSMNSTSRFVWLVVHHSSASNFRAGDVFAISLCLSGLTFRLWCLRVCENRHFSVRVRKSKPYSISNRILWSKHRLAMPFGHRMVIQSNTDTRKPYKRQFTKYSQRLCVHNRNSPAIDSYTRTLSGSLTFYLPGIALIKLVHSI